LQMGLVIGADRATARAKKILTKGWQTVRVTSKTSVHKITHMAGLDECVLALFEAKTVFGTCNINNLGCWETPDRRASVQNFPIIIVLPFMYYMS